MKKLRVFIGLTPPREILEKIGEIQEELKKKNYPINWENPERLHLTLVFLGHITQDRMEAAATAAEQTAKNFLPFELQIGGLSYFYKRGADSIIYLELLDKEKNLANLYKKLFGSLAGEEFFPPTRFQGHISLGRLKKQRFPHERKRILAQLASVGTPEAGNFTVSDLEIYESIFDSRAAAQRYHLLKSFPLGPP